MTNTARELNFDVHQLAVAELYTPKPEESLAFFTKLMGMTVVHRDEKSVYLRAYEDTYLYSLKLTAADEAGLAYTGFRTSSQAALDRRVAALDELGIEGEWITDHYGFGPSYRFKDLDGHTLELFWEVERYKAPEHLQSGLINRSQRKPLRGVPVRRIDHINLLTHPDNVHKNHEFFLDALGFNLREAVQKPDGEYFATWLSVSPLVHEVALMGDELGQHGRLHHLAYWYGLPQHLNDLAEACVEWGIPIEAGPLKHGVSQALCMYIIEPGGNRIELFGDSGYLIFEPDWEPVIWTEKDKERAIIWFGGELPETYFRYGTPQVTDPKEALNVYNKPIKNKLEQANFIYDVSDAKVDELYRGENPIGRNDLTDLTFDTDTVEPREV
ncbi:catechol 2,3-dioxygenase [Aerococcus agrisoli]|uniref:Catechol 2,3-dioxygenase n=1 Tax=Aerococcus agrisoli TaxID=2487350 RepID=A0A3N4GIS8_9LACT|nr:VOC family protein [Aerococcus agrisoli]RPA60476.1 catechol 2,3-dioxygenase [Aerococcus agrisoli]